MGQNVFVAAYVEFQLGTGSKPGASAAQVKNPDAIYEYGQTGRIGLDTNNNGFKEVDCSALAWRGLKDAGYGVPDNPFTTRELFNGNMVTGYAKNNFDVIDKDHVSGAGSQLQLGDIIMWRSVKSTGTDKNGNLTYDQHVGIFFGYDGAGNPTFYGSQSSTGPAFATARPGSFWNQPADGGSVKGMTIVGALHPKNSFYDPAKDTTLPVTGNSQNQQGFIEGLLQDVQQVNAKVVAAVQSEIDAAIQEAKNAVAAADNLATEAKQSIFDALDQIAQTASDALTQVDRTVMGLQDQMQQVVTELSNQVDQFGQTLGNRFLDLALGVSHELNSLGKQFSGYLDSLGAALTSAGEALADRLASCTISNAVATTFAAATAYRPPPRQDPLVLDLDGDGIESTGINATAPVMFDIDASGVQVSVGWIKPDDGFLALDRSGNGMIDTGAELFGDATPLSGGGKAADGFAALAQQDSNGDGKVDSQDSSWNSLRVWRDLNQDGISQSDELFILGAVGITAINLTTESTATVLVNGNRISKVGSYVKADGSTASWGEGYEAADVDLIEDTFHSHFTDPLPISAEVEALPTMSGSGMVRNLREAATLSTTLQSLLGQFSQATERADQIALLDAILKAWSDTSTMLTTFTGAYAGHALYSRSSNDVINGSYKSWCWRDGARNCFCDVANDAAFQMRRVG